MANNLASAPAAVAPTGSSNATGSAIQTPNPTEPNATVLATRGITAEDVVAVRAALTSVENIVAQWPLIRPEERRRVKVHSLGAADFRDQIGNLAGQRPEVVPLLAESNALASQQAIVEELISLHSGTEAFLERLKDGLALVARGYQTRLSVAYATLKIVSRTGGSDLQAQVKRAGLRYKRKKKDAAATPTSTEPGPNPAIPANHSLLG